MISKLGFSQKHINILGIRGVPAKHGGFETFADHLIRYLIANGWSVNVYCQDDNGVYGDGFQDKWKGATRTHFTVNSSGPVGTIEFDYKCLRHVLKQPGLDLVLGYNTAVFTIIKRLANRRVVMNMDGIEWKRAKWNVVAKVWFWMNEWIGGVSCQVPIADHPEIANHLKNRGIKNSVVIPYGSEIIESADKTLLQQWNLTEKNYFISIARIEPENSILEIIQAFVKSGVNRKLIILGNLDLENNLYHVKVKAAASDRVNFLGAIYDRDKIEALRYFCLAYMHGHQVGGTNPSLVEALGAGSPIIAHDNRFNRWTAGENQLFFKDIDSCSSAISRISKYPDISKKLQKHSRKRHSEEFLFHNIEKKYLEVFDKLYCQPTTRKRL